MQSGDWSLRIGVYKVAYDGTADAYANEGLDTKVHVGIVERQIDAPTTGTIDVQLAFGPESGISAATAPTHETIQAALSQIDESLSTVGVHLGKVSYRDAEGIPGTIDLGGPSCLGGLGTEQVFDLAPEAPPGVLQLLFSDHFKCESDGFDTGIYLAGVSNGIPGLPFAARDGMLITTNNMVTYPEDWSLILAHELGHFLGVFHTCEGIGACDNIPDTPEGDAASGNLMYPNVSNVTSTGFSPQQGSIIRLSPLVHPG
jgi:hypothetical protein